MNSLNEAVQDVQAGDLAPRVARIGLVVGVVGLLVGAGFGLTGDAHAKQHFWFAWLVAFAYVLTIGMGTLFFSMIQHLVNAHWSVTVRRLAEITMANLPAICLLGLPLLVPLLDGHGTLWKWAGGGHHGEEAAHGAEVPGGESGAAAEAVEPAAQADPLGVQLAEEEHHEFVEHKRPFLNSGFFIARLIGYFLIWALMARFFFRGSVAQDSASDAAPTLRMKKWSAPAIIVFALTLSFAAFDLLMSLDETWFSTIFGVYIFAGSFVACFAWLVVCAKFLQSRGVMKNAVTREHYHDLGKFMFAFVFFWGYIAFSQFMLIWYANIPEETHWYANRITPAWINWSWLLLIGHFLIPFPGLLSRHVKRRTGVLLFWAIYMLVMHWVDLYWIVMPNLDPQHVNFGVVDVALTLGMVGILVFLTARRASGQALLPVNDPLLPQSLGFKNA